jgi:hypothetical protein
MQIDSANLMYNLLEGSSLASTHEVEVKLEDDAGVLRQDRRVLLSLIVPAQNVNFRAVIPSAQPPNGSALNSRTSQMRQK